MQVIEVPPGTLLAALGKSWAVFSEFSGETHLLNDEAAAFLEVLLERPRTVNEAAEAIAADSGLAVKDVLDITTSFRHYITLAVLIYVKQGANLLWLHTSQSSKRLNHFLLVHCWVIEQ